MPVIQIPDAYRDDLAFVHDAGFGQFARGASALLLAELKRRRLRSGLVVDLGCGSGILSEAVSKVGFDVLGVDLSPAMIELAQRRAPKAIFRVGSLFDVDIPPCIAVTIVGECVNYLSGAANSRESFRALLGRIHDALDPKGLLLFDVAEPGRVPPPGRLKNFAEGDDWAVLYEAVEDKKSRQLTRSITTFRKSGPFYRRTHEVHHVRLIPRSHVLADLKSVGFRARVLRAYSDTRFGQGHVGFLATKAKGKKTVSRKGAETQRERTPESNRTET